MEKRVGNKRFENNMNKTKIMVVGREPAVRPQRGRYPCGVCEGGLE